jgi:hypothetical protein
VSAVAENQPANKHRLNIELSSFATRLREIILSEGRCPDPEIADGDSWNLVIRNFNSLALELFALQFKHNAAYRKICESRQITPQVVEHWTQIPAVPTSAFKELELTCLALEERTTVFHSSGTTEQAPSRHFHNGESLAVYESSLWTWFAANVTGAPNSSSARFQSNIDLAETAPGAPLVKPFRGIILTPPPERVLHSSLVRMFEIVRQKLGGTESAFLGKLADDGAWTLDFSAVVEAFSAEGDEMSRPPLLLLGTAFSFVHLLDYLMEQDLRIKLPAGARVMETGGYKNRSRTMPKAELHALITERLGVSAENIICEYGMSELSSQAYALAGYEWQAISQAGRTHHSSLVTHHFRFPPWARVQIISPETGREVAEGETGLIRIFDLANVFSVAAVQTEDLGIRRGEDFELIGRAQLAEPRGCSLMTA